MTQPKLELRMLTSAASIRPIHLKIGMLILYFFVLPLWKGICTDYKTSVISEIKEGLDQVWKIVFASSADLYSVA
jgi:hypothetical protein